MPTLEEYDEQLSGYEAKVEQLFRTPAVSDFLNDASILREQADIMLAKLRARGPTAIKTSAAATVEGRVNALIHRLESLTTTNVICRDNAKVLYQEAGQWARHFSTVRMTVATFTITSCTAIVALASKPMDLASKPMELASTPGRPASALAVADPVVLLWVLGLTVFWIFTIATYREVYRQRQSLPVFLGKSLNGGAKALKFDWASLVVAFLNLAALFFLPARSETHSSFAEPALWVMTGAGFLFLAIYRKCATSS